MRIENGILREIEDSDVKNGTVEIPEGVLRIEWSEAYREKLDSEYFKRIHYSGWSSDYEIKHIKFPESLLEIADDSFRHWLLEDVALPDSVRKIGNAAFSQCYKLKQVTLPSAISEIPSYCFESCSALEHIVVPDGVTKIGRWAFRECKNLSYIGISDTLETIDFEAFYGCNNIEEIVLPSSIKSIGAGCFTSSKMTVVLMQTKEACDINNASFARASYDQVEPACIIVDGYRGETDRYGQVYANMAIPDAKSYIVQNKKQQQLIAKHRSKSTFTIAPEIIEEYKLPKGKTLKRMDVKRKNTRETATIKGFEIIGNHALAECPHLKEITIDEGVKVIGRGAFAFCSELEKVKLPSTLKTIYMDAFRGCGNLDKLEIPKGVKVIGGRAFKDCKELSELTLPDGLEIINDELASGCEHLATVNMPKSLKSIGKEAFSGTEILGVDLPKGVVQIKDRAFMGTKISTVAFPTNMEFVGQESFKDCTELVSLTLNDRIGIIPDGCFQGCSSLPTVTIPNGVKKINDKAFEGCTSLGPVLYKGEIEGVERSVSSFENCSNVHEMSIDQSKMNSDDDIIEPPKSKAKIFMEDIKAFVKNRSRTRDGR